MTAEISELLGGMRRVFAGLPAHDGESAREQRRALELLREFPPVTGGFPVSAHDIMPALRTAEWREVAFPALLSSFCAMASWLPWENNYPERSDAPGLGGRIAFAELIGPSAPLRSGRVCLGWTFMAPHTLYPRHHHPAVELYAVIAGSARWTVRDETEFRHAGELVLHPSDVPHAMETDDGPLLALYIWTGRDVVTPSAYA